MPRYDYVALNNLALDDSGHFVFLSAWQYVACLSIMEQASPLYLWADDQHPLTPSEIDDLDAKLAEAQFQLMTNPLIGCILPCAAAAIPAGTLLCDGSAYLRTDYPNLYAALDPVFIVDADNFIVPDLQDRFVMGSSGSHTTGDPGGSATITQTIAQMPSHNHTSPPHSHTEVTAAGVIVSVGLEPPVPAAVPSAGLTGSTAVAIDNTGGGDPMDILPPFLPLRYVVIAK